MTRTAFCVVHHAINAQQAAEFCDLFSIVLVYRCQKYVALRRPTILFESGSYIGR